jgi:hypothetical protein
MEPENSSPCPQEPTAWTQSARRIQFTTLHPISLKSILMLSSRFPSRFPIEILRPLSSSQYMATGTNQVPHYTIFSSFPPHAPLTSSLTGPNIPLAPHFRTSWDFVLLLIRQTDRQFHTYTQGRSSYSSAHVTLLALLDSARENKESGNLMSLSFSRACSFDC